MGPTATVHDNPTELRAKASGLRASARKYSLKGLTRLAGDLIASAAGYDLKAQRLMDAADMEETAEYLDDLRSRGTATPSNPYGELHA